MLRRLLSKSSRSSRKRTSPLTEYRLILRGTEGKMSDEGATSPLNRYSWPWRGMMDDEKEMEVAAGLPHRRGSAPMKSPYVHF